MNCSDLADAEFAWAEAACGSEGFDELLREPPRTDSGRNSTSTHSETLLHFIAIQPFEMGLNRVLWICLFNGIHLDAIQVSDISRVRVLFR